MKDSVEEYSPYLRPFCAANVRVDRWILLDVSFKHIFITETRFMVIGGSLTMLYKFCPNQIIRCIEYYKQLM